MKAAVVPIHTVREVFNSTSSLQQLTSKLKQSGITTERIAGSRVAPRIRQALQKAQPVVLRIGDNSVLVLGEDAKGFLAEDKDGRQAVLSDAIVGRGDEAVVVTQSERPRDFFVFVPYRDTWPESHNDMRHNAMAAMTKVENTAPEATLPEHPVVVTFQVGDKKDHKEKVRSHTIGATITVIDPTDAITELLHELGHVFWKSRLTDDEKQGWKEIHSTVDEQNPPSICESPYEFSDPEELFCTVYQWYMKGFAISPSYFDILERSYPQGWEWLCVTFDRISTEAEDTRAWKNNEAGVSRFMKAMRNELEYVQLESGLVASKKIEAVDVPVLAVPIPFMRCEVYDDGTRQYYLPRTGELAGQAVPFKDGKLDLTFLRKAKRHAGKVPVTVGSQRHWMNYEELMKAKTDLVTAQVPVNRKGRIFTQTVYRSPDIEHAELNKAETEHIQPSIKDAVNRFVRSLQKAKNHIFE